MSLPFFTYMLRCSDGSYNVGHTDDLSKRLQQHRAGEGARYTQARRPVELVWHQQFSTRDAAKIAEVQIKGWRRAKKEALIAGRFDLVSLLGRRGNSSRALRLAQNIALRDAPTQGVGAPQGERTKPCS